MVTPRYHYGTIVAIFLALGLGILLGGSLGQQWLSEKQQELLSKLEEKYNESTKTNQELEQKLEDLNEKAQTFEEDSNLLWREGLKNMLKEEKILFLKEEGGIFPTRLIDALQTAGSTVQLSNVMDVDQTRLQDTSLIVLHPQLLQGENYQWIVQDLVQTHTIPVILLNENKVPNWLLTDDQTTKIVAVDLSKMEERLGSLAFVRIAEQTLEETRAAASITIEEEVLPDVVQ